jgi:hypothetical protein
MWPDTFESRLLDWNDLRSSCARQDTPIRYSLINDWWFRAPMVNRYLHWDDWRDWPTPWELLNDNIYCDLARALGMLYTIIMIDPQDHIELARCDQDNLVRVQQGKYILNWCPGDIVNIRSQEFTVTKTLDGTLFQKKLG